MTCVTLLRTSQMMRERGYARNIYLLDDFHMIMHGRRRRRRVSIRWRRRNPEKRHKLCIMYTLLLLFLLNFWVVFSLRALNYSSNKSACAAPPHITEAKSKLFFLRFFFFSLLLYFTVFYDAAMLDKAGQQKAGLP